jgi:hypothetical protein
LTSSQIAGGAQRAFDPFREVGPVANPAQPEAVGHVLEHGLRKRIRLLEDHADPHPHLDRIDAGTDQIDVVGPQHDRALVAGVGLQIVHPVEAAKEGALAAARRTDESGHLVLWDREIDALERLIAAVPEVERLGSRLGRVGAHGFAVLDRDRNAGRPGRGAGLFALHRVCPPLIGYGMSRRDCVHRGHQLIRFRNR